MPQIEFAWDPAKAASNVAKHRVTFAQGATMRLDPLAMTVLNNEHGGREERWLTLGRSRVAKTRPLSHTYTSKGPEVAMVRIISARETTCRERQQFKNMS